jgi:8-oxo-dGTP pyrophosphatase MutT (NUDIX family)
MSKAARAIIIEGDKILVMHRNKHGSEYFTLVGGRVMENETIEQALVREIKEETGLTITDARPVFIEEHAEPYNEQYVFLCEVAPHADVAIQDTSEEGFMNRMGINTHSPAWAEVASFTKLPFRTPQLQAAIDHAIKKGFPASPIKL